MVKDLIERTFIAVKHDGVQRGLVGEIIKRFEQRGLKLVAMKMVFPTEAIADKHYVLTPAFIEKLGENTRKAAASRGAEVKETNEEIATRVKNWNMKYLTEGPVVAMIWEGFHAIEVGRKIVGPAESKGAPIGTIRGDFSTESYGMADKLGRPLRNLVHASGNKEEADNEVALWFKPEEIFGWETNRWKVMHKY
ncbi:nucleoside-diphosphate kinase [Candidatus Woesearchaeota archaeon]|jgi:nucleoside-diphosphate kinase|nr:nucleoside-diphosphate kinase [Candidatus Woesearchaeota archaeon]MBT4336888.1 nucleoside-diphosphate kinase [Candidatus Woesearchaeota archaeon]MBT4469797.1 nucleoside-diphosphate kinase [Candidatus Woesearchaeota archaeon]MBT6743732.1 nucleoside-diphosphate kinase [Candidatus Woesearchaeota archaeon]